MPRRSSNKAVDAIEQAIERHVAGRIRLRRGLLGMSQSDAARLVGGTFQQFQKYEKGSNRVSVAKLFRLADILDAPLTYFFDGLDLPDVRLPLDGYARSAQASAPILSRRELDLVRAWRAAPSEVADEVAGLLLAVEAADGIPPAAPTDDEASAPTAPAVPMTARDEVRTSPILEPEAVTPPAVADAAQTPSASPPQNKRGRPKGSRNQPKPGTPPAGGNRTWSPRDIRRA